jgi:hypothetical protein
MEERKDLVAPVFFVIPHCAVITGLSENAIDNLVQLKVLRPAIPGGRGRRNPRCFSPQQLVGLCVGVALRGHPRRCSRPFFKSVVEEFGKWKWESVCEFLQLSSDTYSEESLALNLNTISGLPIAKENSPSWTEADERATKAALRKLTRLRKELLKRLDYHQEWMREKELQKAKAKR